MVVGIVFLKQMPKPVQMIAVPMALLGLTLIVGFDWNALSADYKLGVILGFLTAAAYAAYLLTLYRYWYELAERDPTPAHAQTREWCPRLESNQHGNYPTRSLV